MKITGVEISRVYTRLKTPFITALRRLDRIENIMIRITTDTGETGTGGAAPTAVITGDTAESIIAAVKHITEHIKGMDLSEPENIFIRINSCIKGNTSAKAAVDMAVYDLMGKLYSVPVFRLLGGNKKQLTTDITISMNPPEVMVKDSLSAVEDGHSSLKIKLGSDPDLDLIRISEIRKAAGDSVILRIDANQGWSPDSAARFISKAERLGIEPEFIEQPVKAGDFKGLRFVKERSPFPVVADESLFSPEDAMALAEMQAADGFNIKLMKCGGIYNALKIAAIAETAGIFCMVGSMMESHTGITAAAHFAAAKNAVSESDLDVPLLCSEKPEEGGAVYTGSVITFPEAPGLGITGWES